MNKSQRNYVYIINSKKDYRIKFHSKFYFYLLDFLFEVWGLKSKNRGTFIFV